MSNVQDSGTIKLHILWTKAGDANRLMREIVEEVKYPVKDGAVLTERQEMLLGIPHIIAGDSRLSCHQVKLTNTIAVSDGSAEMFIAGLHLARKAAEMRNAKTREKAKALAEPVIEALDSVQYQANLADKMFMETAQALAKDCEWLHKTTWDWPKSGTATLRAAQASQLALVECGTGRKASEVAAEKIATINEQLKLERNDRAQTEALALVDKAETFTAAHLPEDLVPEPDAEGNQVLERAKGFNDLFCFDYQKTAKVKNTLSDALSLVLGARDGVNVWLDQLNAMADARREAVADREKAEQARKEEARLVHMMEWADKHGSQRLQEQHGAEMRGWPRYLHERVADMFGRRLCNDQSLGDISIMLHDDATDWDELVNPDIDELKAMKGAVVRLSAANPWLTPREAIDMVSLRRRPDAHDEYGDELPSGVYVVVDGFVPFDKQDLGFTEYVVAVKVND
ncbi:MAG: hypothetical protein KAJ19_19860 [Gammaproteobacteria bacterium]|nr:hypothetical protein [Gammaproteobacteria bacterium]